MKDGLFQNPGLAQLEQMCHSMHVESKADLYRGSAEEARLTAESTRDLSGKMMYNNISEHYRHLSRTAGLNGPRREALRQVSRGDYPARLSWDNPA